MIDYDYHVKIGEVIKELRTKKGITKTELARGICSVSYITRIEKGERCPTSLILRQIANKLQVTPNYLFSIIESPNALRITNMINNLILLIERSDYIGILNYLKDKNEISIPSIADYQLIEGIRVFAETMEKKDYTASYKKFEELLNLTYIEGSVPSGFEFICISILAYIKYLNNEINDAYNMLYELYKHYKKISIIPSFVIVPRFLSRLIVVCISLNKYDEALVYIEEAIKYSKEKNIHFILCELFLLKGEIQYYLDEMDESDKWIKNAYTLNSLIYENNEHFIKFANDRLKNINPN